jgi:hypothetical protein
VAGTEKPIEIPGVPPGNEVESRIERFDDAPKLVQGDASQLPPLDPGDR